MPRTRNGIISAEIVRTSSEFVARRDNESIFETQGHYHAVSCEGV
jgi:hypothetical protein